MDVKKRFFKVIWIFFKIFLDFNKEFKIRKKKGYEYSQIKMGRIHKFRANQLYDIAISLGGVLIKLCQYLSTRRDILPDSYIKILSNLQDNVPPVEFKNIQIVINEEYKNECPFEYIEEIPLASASLGQTHKARLKTGEEVVLKILKPEIEKIIDMDFAILFYVFKLFSHFNFFKENMDFYNVLEEFIKVTGDELNFKREVYIAKRLKESLKKFEYLKIPYIYENFSNNKIIVMEFIDGVKINEKEKWINNNNDPLTIARRLVEIYSEQFLFIKLIHFDPHPGNIFILKNNNIGLVDFGMAGEITEKMNKGIKDGLSAFAKKDYIKILEVLHELGFIKKNVDIYVLLPVVEYFFNEIIDTIKLEKNSIQNINLNPILDDLVEIIYSQPFRLPYEWAYIGKTIGSLTGIISLLYPEFKIHEELKPYFNLILKKNIFEISKDIAELTKTTFNDLLVLPGKVNNIIKMIEKGDIKFKVDFEDVDKKIIELEALFTRGISIALVFFTGTVAYFLYILNHKEVSLIFGFISILSFFYFLFYRKKTKKDIIKKTIKR